MRAFAEAAWRRVVNLFPGAPGPLLDNLPASAVTRASVTPSVLYAEHVDDDGSTVSLALLRTRWATEGQAVFERTDEAGHIDMIEHAAWFVDFSGKLRLDDSSKALIEESELVNVLTAKFVEQGAGWGIRARETL